MANGEHLKILKQRGRGLESVEKKESRNNA